MALAKEPQCVLAFEKMPCCEIRIVAVKENDHNAFRHYENSTTRRGHFLLQPRRDVRQVLANFQKR